MNQVLCIKEILKINPVLYTLKNDEKKDTIDVCFKGKVFDYIVNLLYVLIDNKRGGYILDVLKEFSRIALNELNIKRGIVYTTIKLASSELSKMEKKVSSILNANVTLKNVIDSSIVGGFKIQVDDYILDDSIKNRLAKLKDSVGEVTTSITQSLGNGLQSLGGGIVGSIANEGVSSILDGGKIIFPDIWSDSSYDKSYQISIKLRSPDNDSLSIFLNVIKPYCKILALTLPHTIKVCNEDFGIDEKITNIMANNQFHGLGVTLNNIINHIF